MNDPLSVSPYVQASEIEKTVVPAAEPTVTRPPTQPIVARPLPTPPSTLPPRRGSLTSGLQAVAAPVLGAAAAAAGEQAQKALVTNCPHCQAFLAQAQKKDWQGMFTSATNALAPVAQKAAGSALVKLKSRLGVLDLINKLV